MPTQEPQNQTSTTKRFDRTHKSLLNLLSTPVSAENVKMTIDQEIAKLFGGEQKEYIFLKLWNTPENSYTIQEIDAILRMHKIHEAVTAEELINEKLTVSDSVYYTFKKIPVSDEISKYQLERK